MAKVIGFYQPKPTTWLGRVFIRWTCKHYSKVFDEVITVKQRNDGKLGNAHCERCSKRFKGI